MKNVEALEAGKAPEAPPLAAVQDKPAPAVQLGRAVLAVDIIQAAKLIGVCDDTIRTLINRHQLRAARVGRVWRVRVSEIENFLRRCEK